MSHTLTLGPGLKLPLETVTETLAILGIRGSGKTNTAVCLAEDLLAAGQQVVAVDPTDVWYGLKSSADGKAPGYPVVVFGGRHGDVPLAAGDGATVADFVVEERVPAVLSLRHLESQAAMRQLVTDFARRLYHRKGEAGHDTPLMLVIDEAHLFCPQRVDSGTAPMVGAIQRLVRQGRASGIGVTVIDQRASSVNKDILTQLELLVCHRTSSPQDRKALDGWVEQHDTGAHRKEFLDQLASLPKGTAWFWSPGWLDLFQQVAVRARRTFDSSATPKAGARLIEPTAMAPVDLDRLRVKLATQLERAKADDPKQLKQRIAELERSLRTKIDELPPAKVAPPTMVEVPVLPPESLQRLEAAAEHFVAVANQIPPLLTQLREIQAGAMEEAKQLLDRARPIASHQAASIRMLRAYEESEALSIRGGTRGGTPGRSLPVSGSEKRKSPPANPAAGLALSRPQQKILDALRWLEEVARIDRPTRRQVALVAEVSSVSSGYEKNVSTLSAAGLVSYPGAGQLQLTMTGRGAAHEPELAVTTAALQESLYRRVSGPQSVLLQTLVRAYPEALSRAELARRAKVSEVSSGYEKNVSTLRSLGLVDYPAQGEVAAAGVLFLEGDR